MIQNIGTEFKINDLIKKYNHKKNYFNAPDIAVLGLVTLNCGIAACKIKKKINLKNYDYDIFIDLLGNKKRKYCINLNFLYGCDAFHSIKINGLDSTDYFCLNFNQYNLLNQENTLLLDTFNPIPIAGLTTPNSMGIFIVCDKSKKITLEFEINYYNYELRKELIESANMTKLKIISILDKLKMTNNRIATTKLEYTCEKHINDKIDEIYYKENNNKKNNNKRNLYQ